MHGDMLQSEGSKGPTPYMYAGFTGYSAYAPTKYAVRGLADTLRNEVAILSFVVQMVFRRSIPCAHTCNNEHAACWSRKAMEPLSGYFCCSFKALEYTSA